MFNFGVGLLLGGAIGLCIARILSSEEDSEQSDEWFHEYSCLEKRVNEAIHYAVVIRDAAGYRHIAVSKHLDEIIRILNGDEVKE